jgi:hypothetical protein
MIQMKDSRDIRFDNVKVNGGSPGNANQDDMDWLGGGDSLCTTASFAQLMMCLPCRETGMDTLRRR